MHIKSSSTKYSAIAVLLLGCLTLSPALLAVVPAPDGGYPGNNTAEGQQALQSRTTGVNDTALGYQALYHTTTGSYNSAEGSRALFRNTIGSNNTANGAAALFNNTIGVNNVADGSNALVVNTTGNSNTAAGFRALSHNTTGSNNIALGVNAGINLTTGNNNIDIGSPGVAGESGIIRIGTVGIHTDTFLGRTRVDVVNTSNNAATFIGTGNGNTLPTTHVVHIQTNQPDNSGCLALQTSDTAPSGFDNFITFFNGSGGAMGRIEAVNATTTQYVTTGSDFAETLPVARSAQPGRPAEIVPVHRGEIGDWDHGDHFMVISNQAGFVGNDPGKEAEAAGRYHQVAFLGQVPVKIRGAVSAGDYVIASKTNDGTGIAKPANKIRVGEMHRVVGRAWESSAMKGLKEVNTAVGLDQTSLVVPALQRLERENQELRAKLTELEARDQAREARLSSLEDGARLPVYRPQPPR